MNFINETYYKPVTCNLNCTGTWNGNADDEFEYSNGTVIDITTLEPTTHLDVLGESMLERPLYEFGLSCKNIFLKYIEDLDCSIACVSALPFFSKKEHDTLDEVLF